MRDPEAIESFALASKTIYSLGSSVIEEHNRLRSELSSIFSSDADNCSPLAELLGTLLFNPRAALYVRNISVDGWRDVWDHPNADPECESCHLPYTDMTMKLFQQAVEDSPFIPKDQVESWIEELLDGDEGAVLSLLVMRLPNVKSLNISRMGASGFHLLTTILHIAQSQDTGTLSRLMDVQLSRTSWAMTGWVQAFSALPSVEAIKVSGYCHEHDWDFADFQAESQNPRIALPSKSSAVTHLTLGNCAITTERICRTLNGLQALENFDYLGAAGSMGILEPQKMVSALLANARHSLQTLCLTSSEEHISGTVNLADFEVLKEIDIESELLSSDTGRINFTESLPPAVEEVRLYRLRRFRWVEDDISQMVMHKAERLPNFKRLTIELNVPEAPKPELLQRMMHICEGVGVLLRVYFN